MIKSIQSKNVGVAMVSDESIKLTINGQDTILSIDELNELREVTNQLWGANDLYRQTLEAKADRNYSESLSGAIGVKKGW